MFARFSEKLQPPTAVYRFNKEKETIELKNLTGTVGVAAKY